MVRYVGLNVFREMEGDRLSNREVMGRDVLMEGSVLWRTYVVHCNAVACGVNGRDGGKRVWLCMVVLSQWRVEGRPNRGRHVKGLEVGG